MQRIAGKLFRQCQTGHIVQINSSDHWLSRVCLPLKEEHRLNYLIHSEGKKQKHYHILGCDVYDCVKTKLNQTSELENKRDISCIILCFFPCCNNWIKHKVRDGTITAGG